MQRRALLALPVFVLVTLTIGFAAEPDTPSVVAVELQPVSTGADVESGEFDVSETVDARARSPRMVAFQKLLQDEASELERLQSLFEQTRDPERAAQLQREMGAVKAKTEIDILKVQLEFARREGRLELVAGLEQVIEEMTAPRPHVDAALESPAIRH